MAGAGGRGWAPPDPKGHPKTAREATALKGWGRDTPKCREMPQNDWERMPLNSQGEMHQNAPKWPGRDTSKCREMPQNRLDRNTLNWLDRDALKRREMPQNGWAETLQNNREETP